MQTPEERAHIQNLVPSHSLWVWALVVREESKQELCEDSLAVCGSGKSAEGIAARIPYAE